MIHTRIDVNNDVVTYDGDGRGHRGSLFVGEDHVVRWFSIDKQHEMEGVGKYSPRLGYNVYDDSPVEELAR